MTNRPSSADIETEWTRLANLVPLVRYCLEPRACAVASHEEHAVGYKGAYLAQSHRAAITCAHRALQRFGPIRLAEHARRLAAVQP